MQNLAPVGLSDSQHGQRMGEPSRTADASGWGMDGQESRRTPLIDMSWMVCQYSTRGLVSSEKHETAAEPGAEQEG